MPRIPHPLKSALLPFIFLTACEAPEDHAAVEMKPVSKPIASEKTPIHLKTSTEMINPLETEDRNFLAPVDVPSTSFKKIHQERRVTFSGKFHINDKEENYINAIDGAEVNVKVKFK